MSKKRIPKSSRKRLAFFGTISIIVILYFVIQLFFYMYKIYDLRKEQRKLDRNYTSLKADEKELRTEIDKLQDPDYIARYARENYSYSKNGEYIIKINEDKKEDEIDDSFKFDINIDYQYIVYGVIIFFTLVIIFKSKHKNRRD